MRLLKKKTISAKQLIAFMSVQILLSASCSANVAPINKGQKSITKMECKLTPLEQSKTIIESILQDVIATYTQVGGGGITAIKQSHSNVFVVSIAQEERIDQLTYEVMVDESCKVRIIKKESSSINYNR